mmetsp:Transcript_55811/g.76844  ORF Transcript_55811/g.76844 Transcript_55811/m.76844 type:complete len:116 (+) Transcript_55811:267-614(+)
MLQTPVMDHLKSLNRNQIVLYGLEAHVCVRQTAFELLENDFEVTLVTDACSSMTMQDRNVGIESIRDAGGSVTSFQALVYELMRTCKHPQFKPMLKVVKNNPEKQLDLSYTTHEF